MKAAAFDWRERRLHACQGADALISKGFSMGPSSGPLPSLERSEASKIRGYRPILQRSIGSTLDCSCMRKVRRSGRQVHARILHRYACRSQPRYVHGSGGIFPYVPELDTFGSRCSYIVTAGGLEDRVHPEELFLFMADSHFVGDPALFHPLGDPGFGLSTCSNCCCPRLPHRLPVIGTFRRQAYAWTDVAGYPWHHLPVKSECVSAALVTGKQFG